MKINNNISAVIANKHLLRNENALSTSMERLSSGYKLNHAKDNPSGMAISNKMRAQIRGLDRASQNSQDGVSLLNTADGAISETTSILQRMRELAVQAANDTNTDSDKEAIQLEMTNLRSEVDRISSTTEFNTKNLLDGTLDRKAYADDVSRLQVSDSVSAGTYEIELTQAATRAHVDGKTPSGDVPDGSFTVNGRKVELKSTMTADEAYEELRKQCEYGNVSAEKDSTEKIILKSGSYNDEHEQVLGTAWGEGAKISISVDSNDAKSQAAASYFGFKDNSTDPAHGENAKVKLQGSFTSTATSSVDGRKITVTDNNGFEMSFVLDKASEKTGETSTIKPNDGTAGASNKKIKIEVTDIGPMDLQVGANTQQQMVARIDAMDTKSLYIDDLDVTKTGGPDLAIARLDSAISKVNENRARIGALSNRLDNTISNLENASENMNSAISKLKDTDMATEMVEFTKDNVLQQAGTSALSQANELPQLALQLLQ
ncbi:MAG: flagellin [Lachnospiraceae bacterium]|nr:flagellin [Lachnospiraceae bacterium]